ncbi:MAG TPA: hypothetical protein DCR10_08480 [Acidimicrobiaceae bacterium]|nr:hypothetical protein [Acidimicrobiaceae bacterium]
MRREPDDSHSAAGEPKITDRVVTGPCQDALMVQWSGTSVVTGPATVPISVRFAEAARVLGQEARLKGLEVPTFRSPPSLPGVQRTIRRRGSAAIVSVVVRNRPWSAVLADMIEGILVSNRLESAGADTVRADLWLAVDEPALAA